MSANPAIATTVEAKHRGLITFSVMLATILVALDLTIANVALPHMQGNMSATPEQISWVLTSYIVASGICMPLTGFLAVRFGRKRVFLWSVAGFVIASAFCGSSQNIEQIVVARLLQGMFGASLIPMSQAVLLDIYPTEKHGAAMAFWAFGSTLGPILGPTLGGWLTEYYSWRWVFFINLPFGILAWIGIAAYLRETRGEPSRRFDVIGFSMLSLGVGALQMMLDRGEMLNWFNSREIVVNALLAGFGFYLFVVHIFTRDQPFVEPGLFKDRNFTIGLLSSFMNGALLFASLALLPPFLQNLRGYPVIDVGLLLVPRGIATMMGLIAVGKFSAKMDARYQLFFGLVLNSVAMWDMSHFSLEFTTWDIIRTGFTQGLGIGFTYVPLSALTFSTLLPHYRNEGTSLFNLVRNTGGSIGISVVIAMLSRNIQTNHAVLAEYVTPFSLPLNLATESGNHILNSPLGLATLNAEVTRQAAMLSYLHDFRMLMWFSIAAVPLVLFLRTQKNNQALSETLVSTE